MNPLSQLFTYFIVFVERDLTNSHISSLLQVTSWSVHDMKVVLLITFINVRYSQQEKGAINYLQ